jgi:hypothetical protein
MAAPLRIATASASHGIGTRSRAGATGAEWPTGLRIAPEALLPCRSKASRWRVKPSPDCRRTIARSASRGQRISRRLILSESGRPPGAGERDDTKKREGGLADHVACLLCVRAIAAYRGALRSTSAVRPMPSLVSVEPIEARSAGTHEEPRARTARAKRRMSGVLTAAQNSSGSVAPAFAKPTHEVCEFSFEFPAASWRSPRVCRWC